MPTITKKVHVLNSQGLLFEGVEFPSWSSLADRVKAGPRGTRAELAKFLGVSHPAVCNMLLSDNEPTYGRVRDVMRFIASNGL